MYEVRSEFRTAMLSGDVRHRIRGVITDVTGSDISICEEIGENVRIEQQCTTDTDVFAVGQLYTGTVELMLLGADELQRETLRGGTVTLEFGLEGHDEWVPLGIWNITDPQRGSENSIMIKGVDNTSKLDVEIPVFVGHVKMTDRIRMIKKLTGLEFAQTAEELSALAGADITSNDVFGTSYCPTCRAEVCAIAEFIGGIAFIDREGRIAFRRFGDNAGEYVVPASRRFRADLSEYSFKVTAVSYSEDGKTATTPEAPGEDANTRACLPLNGYPYAQYINESDIADALMRVRDNLASAGVWVPGSFDYAGDPTIDLGDRVYLTGGVTGEAQTAFIVTGQTWQFRGPQTLISAGAGESAGSYNSGGGSAGGGGSSTTVIQSQTKLIELDSFPQELSTKLAVIADGVFACRKKTVAAFSAMVNAVGTTDSELAVHLLVDDVMQTAYAEETISYGEKRTVCLSAAVTIEGGSHTVSVEARGGALIERIVASVYGAIDEYCGEPTFDSDYLYHDDTVDKYIGSSIVPAIPEKLGENDVKVIGGGSFEESEITYAYVPDGAETIE